MTDGDSMTTKNLCDSAKGTFVTLDDYLPLTISDGVIRIEEMHFAGPVPDEGDNPKELEGKRGVDGTWIDPKLLIAGRNEEMEYMMKMGVFEVVDEKRVLRQRLQASHVEMGRQNER